MKLHLYFCSSYLAQKPLGKRCNALRCAALIAPYVYVYVSSSIRWGLSAEPCQSNKRGDLRPDSFNFPVLYRHALSGAA